MATRIFFVDCYHFLQKKCDTSTMYRTFWVGAEGFEPPTLSV
jgi:hypothetical protein